MHYKLIIELGVVGERCVLVVWFTYVSKLLLRQILCSQEHLFSYSTFLCSLNICTVHFFANVQLYSPNLLLTIFSLNSLQTCILDQNIRTRNNNEKCSICKGLFISGDHADYPQNQPSAVRVPPHSADNQEFIVLFLLINYCNAAEM